MDSAEYSRKVAEAMGLRECRRDPGGFHPVGTPNRCKPPRADDTAAIWGGKQCIHPRQRGIDLADARDREAAIAWWRAKNPGGEVVCSYRDEPYVDFYDASGRCIATYLDAPTIEEAFGRAFLAAMGVQG